MERRPGDSGKGRAARWIAATGLALAWLATAACAGEGPAPVDLNRVVDREIGRLEETAAGLDPASLSTSAATGLAARREALAAVGSTRSPELRLYELAEPFVGIETLAFLAHHREAGRSLDALTALRNARRPDFAALPEGTDGSLVSALVETAVTRADRLFHASLQYGRISSPASGLYYLAQAEGNRRFAAMLASAAPGRAEPAAPAAPAAPGPAALLAAADRLERAALHALDGGAGLRDLIPVNVRLDEAREMVEAGRPAGAALQLLAARLRLGRFLPASDASPEPAEEPSGDGADSLAALLRAMAREPGDPDRARIARRALIPLYASLYDSSRPAAPPVTRPPGHAVTLTLVRWPYT